jgi:hypothetical protein
MPRPSYQQSQGSCVGRRKGEAFAGREGWREGRRAEGERRRNMFRMSHVGCDEG